MTPIEEGSSPTEGTPATTGDTQSIAPEEPTATSVDSDCETAIEVKSDCHNAPSLTLVALRVLKAVIEDGLDDVQIDRILPVLIESGDRALAVLRLKEANAVNECLVSMQLHHQLRRTQNIKIMAFCVRGDIAILPLMIDDEQFDSSIILLISIFDKMMPKEILKKYYPQMMPILLEIMGKQRTLALRNATFKVIARFGDAVRMKIFRGDFTKVFCYFIKSNLKQTQCSETLDYCLGCINNKANVIIRKACERDSCDSCACPPVWCSDCLSQSFLRSAPSVDEEAVCPTCRANYCIQDVSFVSDEKTDEH